MNQKNLSLINAAVVVILFSGLCSAQTNESTSINDSGLFTVTRSISIDNDTEVKGMLNTVIGSIRIGHRVQLEGAATVTGSISVGNDVEVKGILNTVNGSISVGHRAQLEDVTAVNGSIMIGDGSIANSISTTNGEINVGKKATINGEISTVNGKIKLGADSNVTKDIININGEILLTSVVIENNVSTVNGDIFVANGSVIHGNIIIKKPNSRGWWWWRRSPRITVGVNSKVIGNIMLEQDAELFFSKSAEVGGVTGAKSINDVVWYSGDKP